MDKCILRLLSWSLEYPLVCDEADELDEEVDIRADDSDSDDTGNETLSFCCCCCCGLNRRSCVVVVVVVVGGGGGCCLSI